MDTGENAKAIPSGLLIEMGRHAAEPQPGDWALVSWFTSKHQQRYQLVRVWEVERTHRTINNGRWHWRQIVEIRGRFRPLNTRTEP